MTQVAVIAKLTAVDGKAEQLSSVIADLVVRVQEDEPNTLVYAAAQDTADPNVFWFYEFYASPEEATIHAAGEPLAEAATRMRGLLAGRPEVHRLMPIAAKGLPG
jgi:quinol monooxygenase YgiN